MVSLMALTKVGEMALTRVELMDALMVLKKVDLMDALMAM